MWHRRVASKIGVTGPGRMGARDEFVKLQVQVEGTSTTNLNSKKNELLILVDKLHARPISTPS